MSTISVAHAPHRELEDDVDEYLIAHGFLTFAAPYHETMPKTVQDRLAFNDSYTSLYLRARADRIAVHTELPLVFEWEAKTHSNNRYANLSVELLPFMHHIQKAHLGVRCMYVFRMPHTGQDGGFWVHRRPSVREVWVTSRITTWRSGFVKRAQELLPEARVVERDPTGGTKDPFVIIDQSEVERQPHWQLLVEDHMRSLVASAPY